MFAVQAAALLAVWIGVGVWYARGIRSRARHAAGMSAGSRIILAILCLIGGALVFYAAFAYVMAQRLATPDGLIGQAWPLLAGAGAVFLAGQLHGGVLLASSSRPPNVTPLSPPASNRTEETP